MLYTSVRLHDLPESARLPESTGIGGELPESTGIGGDLPESVKLPDSTGIGGELPEITGIGGELPESTGIAGELSESTYKTVLNEISKLIIEYSFVKYKYIFFKIFEKKNNLNHKQEIYEGRFAATMIRCYIILNILVTNFWMPYDLFIYTVL